VKDILKIIWRLENKMEVTNMRNFDVLIENDMVMISLGGMPDANVSSHIQKELELDFKNRFQN